VKYTVDNPFCTQCLTKNPTEWKTKKKHFLWRLREGVLVFGYFLLMTTSWLFACQSHKRLCKKKVDKFLVRKGNRAYMSKRQYLLQISSARLLRSQHELNEQICKEHLWQFVTSGLAGFIRSIVPKIWCNNGLWFEEDVRYTHLIEFLEGIRSLN
jgi:hypothetical protein